MATTECGNCGVEDGVFRVTVTNLDGEVYDSTVVCPECMVGIERCSELSAVNRYRFERRQAAKRNVSK
jgi:hypothetical protein